MRRKKYTYTQKEYAKALSSDQPYICRLFNEEVFFTYNQRQQLKSVLGGDESEYKVQGQEAVDILDQYIQALLNTEDHGAAA